MIVTGFYDLTVPAFAYDKEVQIWMVREEHRDDMDLLIQADGSPCMLERPWRLIGTLCSTRALDVEDGLLLVCGNKIKAEQYLQLWRDAPVESVAHLRAKGYSLLWTLRKPSQAMRIELQRQMNREDDMKRRLSLLDHPNMVDDGTFISWSLDLFSEDGMQAYDVLQGIYLPTVETDSVPAMPDKTIQLVRREATPPKDLHRATTDQPDMGQLSLSFSL